MSLNEVRLVTFDGSDFDKGAGLIKTILWYFVNALIVRASWNPFMGIKVALLRAFGAKIGKGLVIKNNVIIKSPWNLVIGDDCWLGENCWIDNLDKVVIGNNVCISQGALLLTGNHDYTISSMPYRNAPIIIEDGAWIGAKTTVCPGVTVHRNAILTVGSVTTKDMEENGIYQGNPAVKIRETSNPQSIGFSGILLAKRQNSFYCTYFLHNRNVADTKSPYPIKRLEVIRWFNQKSMVFNQSLS